MPDLELITDASVGLERCGDLFRADPIGSNMVAASVVPSREFTLRRLADGPDTIGVVLEWPSSYTFTGLRADAVELLAAELPVVARTELLGRPGDVATIAGRMSDRTDGAVVDEHLIRVYRLGDVHKPKKRRGQVQVTGRDRLEQAAAWSVAFGADTGLPRTIEGTTAVMARAINEGRLLEWIVRGEVVSQLLVSPARVGVVRIGGVYTPPELRGRGYAGSLTAAVAEQQMARQKVDEVILNTQAHNPATNRLYRKLGFESVLELLSVHVEPDPKAVEAAAAGD